MPKAPAPGDIVFYFKGGKAVHIGIYWTMGLYFTVDSGGSGTDSEQKAIDQNAFLKIRPVSSRAFPVFVNPFEKEE